MPLMAAASALSGFPSGTTRLEPIEFFSVSSTSSQLDNRRLAAAGAAGSVRAEGLDPSGAEPDLDAWARGEIDTEEMVARGLEAAGRRYGTAGHPAAA